jgi:aryl-alcohol dehydrogenase-like predicted oxidoreductase
MEYVNLGSTGLKVSRICLGTMTYGSKKWREWILEEEEARPFYRRAIEAGINFFDTADVYSLGVSEEITGRALKEYGPSRDKVVIATKVFNAMGDDPNQSGLSRKHICTPSMTACAACKRIMWIFIRSTASIRTLPIEETLEALDQVVRSGKALYIGASSMASWQFLKMLHTSDLMGLSRFVTMQNHYNLVYREEEREMIPLCLDEGVGVIPWSPLARGFLAGNRNAETRGETIRAKTDGFAQRLYYRPSDFTVVDRLTEIAKKRGVQNSQVALAWILAKPGVSAPIIGASKMAHLDQAIEALKFTWMKARSRRSRSRTNHTLFWVSERQECCRLFQHLQIKRRSLHTIQPSDFRQGRLSTPSCLQGSTVTTKGSRSFG